MSRDEVRIVPHPRPRISELEKKSCTDILLPNVYLHFIFSPFSLFTSFFNTFCLFFDRDLVGSEVNNDESTLYTIYTCIYIHKH